MPEEIKQFLLECNIQVSNVKKISKGISNKVYFIKTKNNKKYIIKLYVSKCNDYCKEKLINHCKQEKINTFNTIKKYNKDDIKIEMYDYIKHKNIVHLDSSKISLLTNTIETLDMKIPKSSINYSDTIFYKVNNYGSKLKNMKKLKFNKNILKLLLQRYDYLADKENSMDLYIIHGDLSLSNLLWTKDDITLIDFDEAIIAPKEYEYVSMLIKLCYKKGKFNLILAKKILKAIPINIDNMKKMFDFYIIKVLLEKIYLYEVGIIDLNDKVQRRDNWENWYNLFCNNNLKNKLFALSE